MGKRKEKKESLKTSCRRCIKTPYSPLSWLSGRSFFLTIDANNEDTPLKAAKQAAAEQAEVKAKKAVAVANKATEEERPRSWWCR